MATLASLIVPINYPPNLSNLIEDLQVSNVEGNRHGNIDKSHLWYERCYVCNIFTANYKWLVVIGSNLNLPPKLLFYPTNNNLLQLAT